MFVSYSLLLTGILFWLNCKSVYNYWQNERKQLNAEVWLGLNNMDVICSSSISHKVGLEGSIPTTQAFL